MFPLTSSLTDGRKAGNIFQGQENPGPGLHQWTPSDDLPAGNYIIRLEARSPAGVFDLLRDVHKGQVTQIYIKEKLQGKTFPALFFIKSANRKSQFLFTEFQSLPVQRQDVLSAP